MNLRDWWRQHSLKLLAIRDTPEAIAGGVAIGMFFGLSPLFGLKTLLSLLFAWLTRSNLLAAVIAVTLHDVAFLAMPLVYRFEYDVGYWLLSHPHHWPTALRKFDWAEHAWRSWRTLVTVGKPLLLGSAVCGTPITVATFLITRQLVLVYHRKHAQPAESAGYRGETND